MKKLFAISICFFAVGSCLPVFSQTNLIGPPNGLEYGMTYSETNAALKSKNIKLDKPKEEKKWKLPKGFKVAKVGKYEILDRKTDVNWAFFNADGELCAFRISFRWFESGDNAAAKAKREAQKYWEGELEKAITAKYSGEGFVKHNDPDIDGNVPLIAFRDEVGDELGIYMWDGSNLLGHVAMLAIVYYNEEIVRATRKQQKSTDKF